MEPTGAFVVGAAAGDCALTLATISAAPIATTIPIAIAFMSFIFPRLRADRTTDQDPSCDREFILSTGS